MVCLNVSHLLLHTYCENIATNGSSLMTLDRTGKCAILGSRRKHRQWEHKAPAYVFSAQGWNAWSIVMPPLSALWAPHHLSKNPKVPNSSRSNHDLKEYPIMYIDTLHIISCPILANSRILECVGYIHDLGVQTTRVLNMIFNMVGIGRFIWCFPPLSPFSPFFWMLDFHIFPPSSPCFLDFPWSVHGSFNHWTTLKSQQLHCYAMAVPLPPAPSRPHPPRPPLQHPRPLRPWVQLRRGCCRRDRRRGGNRSRLSLDTGILEDRHFLWQLFGAMLSKD